MGDISSLGPLEKQILEIVWQQKSATVASVREELCGQPCQSKALAYTTIMTIMTRLVAKGILERVKRGKSYVYQAKAPKHTFIQSFVHSLMSNVINRFGDEAVTAFLAEAEQLTHTQKQSMVKTLTRKKSSRRSS